MSAARRASHTCTRMPNPCAAVSTALSCRAPVVGSHSTPTPESVGTVSMRSCKANPGKVTMASPGIGGPSHVSGELFKMRAGVNLVHVPYRGGGPAVTDLLGGQVQVMFAPTPPSIEHIRSGKLRALAVTSATRQEVLPDVPTVGEFLPGFEASNWYGVGIPKNTPAEIVEKLNKEINAGLADSKMQARLADFGGTPLVVSPADFGKLIAEETEKWAKVIKSVGIKAD